MNNNINIAEILKGCPKGMKLYSPIFGEGTLEKIDNEISVTNTLGYWTFSKNGHTSSFPESGEIMLFPSSKMRDWRRFFKRGDVLVDRNCGLGVIFKEWIDDSYISFKVAIYQLFNKKFTKKDEIDFFTEGFSKASDEQRDKFISDMEKFFGGKYNPETLQVELVKPTCSFKPFDKVLVRNCEEHEWYANSFSHYRGEDKDFPYACFGNNFRYCIPYEGNEYLLRTKVPSTEGGDK